MSHATKTVVTVIGDEPKIDPKLVPDYAWDYGCRVLANCIKKALEDPKLRQEYEEWLAKREIGGVCQ